MMFSNHVRQKPPAMMNAEQPLQKTAESVQFCTDSAEVFQENSCRLRNWQSQLTMFECLDWLSAV
jgi:hypothetical protein